MPEARQPVDEVGLELGHRLAVLLADRLAQVVGLGAAEAGELLGDDHRLLLVQDHALGRLEDVAQALVAVVDRLGVVLAARVGSDLIHRSGAVQRHQRDQVVELGRSHPLERLAHALRFKLEDADRLAPREHLVGLLVVERERRHVGARAGRALDDVERVLDHVEVAQPEEVHLQKAHRLDRLHRELRDGAVDLVAVLVGLVGVRQLHGDEVGQRLGRDDHRGGVDRGVADDALEPLRHLDDLMRVGVRLHLGGQRLPGRQAVVELRCATLLGIGDQLGELVAQGIGETEHAGGVARRRAREHLAEGDDLRDRVLAVLLGHVLDHLFTAAHREVDVDIGHRHAFRVEEALEQEVVLERIEVRDAGRVGDQRAGSRATSRADRNAVVARPLDEVPDDQEVAAVAHAVDHAELVFGALQRRRRDRVAEAPGEPLHHQLAQVLGLDHPARAVEARDQLLAELNLDIAALGDLERRGDRLRPLGELLRHLVGRAQVELVGVEGHLRRRQRRLGLHAQQRRVVVVVLTAQVVHVTGADQWATDLARDLHDPGVGLLLVGDAVLLNLEVDVVVAVDLQQLIGHRARLGLTVADQRLAEARCQAAGQRDHALRIPRHQPGVHRRLAALQPLEEARGAELDEVAVADGALRHQGQVVALAALGVVVGDVDLAALDRLDAVLLARLIELHRSVHHAVVGERQRRLAERGRALRELVDLGCAVEQRVLGVDVEVGAGCDSSDDRE